MQIREFGRAAAASAIVVACALPAAAQNAAAPTTQVATETRPATATASGDTGLWFVPTAEILPARRWSFSLYRVNFDYEPGFTDVSSFPVTFGIGLRDRVEIFGAVHAVRRIDRDVRPLFFPTSGSSLAGGVVNDYPFVATGWTGNQFGDIWLGAKVNLTSQYRQQPAAFALRALVKLPTASEDDGAGTGKMDVAFDAIMSREANERVEYSLFGGLIVRGDPDGLDLLNGFRWGFGVATPSRRNLRLTAEIHGEQYLGDAVEITGPTIQSIDLAPANTEQRSPVNATLGLTWQGANGVFAGAGMNWNLRLKSRDDVGGFESETGDAIGFQFRLGYHPGVRVYVPPPTPPPRHHRRRRPRTGRRRSARGASRAPSRSAGPPQSRLMLRIRTETR